MTRGGIAPAGSRGRLTGLAAIMLQLLFAVHLRIPFDQFILEICKFDLDMLRPHWISVIFFYPLLPREPGRGSRQSLHFGKEIHSLERLAQESIGLELLDEI